jgi:elongation factor P
MYQITEIRKGLKVELDGQPYTVVDFQFVKPGKGQAFTRTRLKNLITGYTLERTFKINESLAEADVHQAKMQYMYQDGEGFHFMNNETYDQVTLQADLVGEQAPYLLPEMKVKMAVYDGLPVSIELPQKVTLEVAETEPAIKSQTAASSYKPATLSNGVRTMVPPFVAAGTRIVVMTADGSYVERAKD